ncbi:uncharacterized protein LOC143450499 [Clavelina lepadiformis]|uniref:uncharacterized protein LOC143450499 n=1 Tax=Clavelina lepadiformis TaxID=159417 RepID=UPI004042DA90
MADALSLSMGGRVASIYKQNTKRRRYTTVVNEIEGKRLGFIKKQIEYDRVIESNKLSRVNNKLINANDEMKAFQIALLRRIAAVRDQSKLVAGTRPLKNLGRYGGASVDYIKAESEKYKRIRDPVKIRMMKAKILLNQGKKDGRIKEFEPGNVGDMAEDILKLYKAENTTIPDLTQANEVGVFDEVKDRKELRSGNDSRSASDSAKDCSQANSRADTKRSSLPFNKPKRLVLPPLQVQRSLKPNDNYYRKISADYRRRQRMAAMQTSLPIHKRLAVLEDIAEEGGKGTKDASHWSTGVYPVTTLSKQTHSLDLNNGKRAPPGGRYFEWDYSKSVRPVKVGKQLNENQKFWRPQESVPKPSKNVVLPSIKGN